jgi:hypothetical protein
MILRQPIESLSDISSKIRGPLIEDLLSSISSIAWKTIDSYRVDEQWVSSDVTGGLGPVRSSSGRSCGRKPDHTLTERLL